MNIKTLKDFRMACHILIWGFAITGGITLLVVETPYKSLLFTSLIVTMLGLRFLIYLSHKKDLT